MRTAIIFLVTIVGCYGQYDTYYCRYLQNYDCLKRDEDLQCGTDGNTYFNECDLSKAHCKQRSIHRRFKGPCPYDTTTTTRPTTQSGATTSKPATTMMPATTMKPTTTMKPVNGSEIAFNIFCLDLFHHTCANEPAETICASDNKEYPNLCEYEKTKCEHRHLTIKTRGPCS